MFSAPMVGTVLLSCNTVFPIISSTVDGFRVSLSHSSNNWLQSAPGPW